MWILSISERLGSLSLISLCIPIFLFLFWFWSGTTRFFRLLFINSELFTVYCNSMVGVAQFFALCEYFTMVSYEHCIFSSIFLIDWVFMNVLFVSNGFIYQFCKKLYWFWGKLSVKIGLRCRTSSSLRSTTPEETSGRTSYGTDEPVPDGDITVETTDVGENIDNYETQQNEAPQEGSLVDNLQFLKFLEEFDIKVLPFDPVWV